MTTTMEHLQAVVDAAQRLLAARDDGVITEDEWEALANAVNQHTNPASTESNEAFSVDAMGALVRSVVPVKGQPYQHRCPKEAFEAVAYAIDHATSPFNLSALQKATNLPFTKVAVAFAFLKERSVVIPAGARMHVKAGRTAFEDAMIEYHALREQPAE